MSERGAWPWAAAAALAISVVPMISETSQAALLFARAPILDGQVWRAFSGHFVHFGFAHWGWNVVVVLLAGAWLERRAPWRTRVFWLVSPLVISGGLLILDPDLQRYGGLSGIATGLVASLTFSLWRGTRQERGWAVAIGGLLAVKLLAETRSGGTTLVEFADASVRNVAWAHVLGAACAVAFAGWPAQMKPARGASGPNCGR